MFENVNGRTIGILQAHRWAFGSGELKLCYFNIWYLFEFLNNCNEQGIFANQVFRMWYLNAFESLCKKTKRNHLCVQSIFRPTKSHSVWSETFPTYIVSITKYSDKTNLTTDNRVLAYPSLGSHVIRWLCQADVCCWRLMKMLIRHTFRKMLTISETHALYYPHTFW